MNLISRLEELNTKALVEMAPVKKTVINHGVRKVILDCPPGFRKDGTACVRLTPQEMRKFSIGAKRGSKKRAARAGQASKSRAKSVAMRDKLGL